MDEKEPPPIEHYGPKRKHLCVGDYGHGYMDPIIRKTYESEITHCVEWKVL